MGGASSVCLYHDRIEAARLLARGLVYHVDLVSDLGRPNRTCSDQLTINQLLCQ